MENHIEPEEEIINNKFEALQIQALPNGNKDDEEESVQEEENNVGHNDLNEQQFSSKLAFNEHPLKAEWTLWFLNEHKQLQWMDRLKNVCTIKSVEQFWALHDNIRAPSQLASGCDYNFFKTPIQPVWEVEENKLGGRLVVQIEKGRKESLDDLWLELLLALIGEQFGEDSVNICGAVCNARAKGDKICLWTKNAEDEDVNKRIGGIMKDRFLQRLKGGQIRINYEEHNAAQSKHSSATQTRFTL